MKSICVANADSVNPFTPALFPLLEREFLAFLPGAMTRPKDEFLIPTVVGELLRKGDIEVEVLRSREHWLGVTYPEDKPIVVAGVREMIDRGLYPPALWA